jgi:hypothetical protein
MSWDGVYAQDRYYPQFEPGDEIFTKKSTWKSITPDKPYEVIKCESTHHNCVYVITIMSDGGYESKYATYHFKKTERQLREDKLKTILQ